MRTIIAGSRNITDYNILLSAMGKAKEVGIIPTVIISGTACGVDKMGERWGRENDIPIEKYPADWEYYGKSAGYKRNEQMAENADALIAIWDGKSRGTKHMIDIADNKGLEISILKKGQWDG